MPHAALIALAVTAGVGSAIAFEVGVFKPWRQEHWPNGIAQGIKQEWEVFAEDVREGFREMSGDHIGHRNGNFGGRRQQRNTYRRQQDGEEEDELRREMDEFSMHDAQTSAMRARMAEEFAENGEGARRRRPREYSSVDASEDRVCTNAENALLLAKALTS
jgi:hypothetical protein